MDGMEWLLEVVLVFLLGATLFQAVRLERALGTVKRDKAAFESLMDGFNASTSQAQTGIQQLCAATDGAGRNIESQLSRSLSLKDDLAFLSERGDRLADRLEILVRAARPLAQDRQPAHRQPEVKSSNTADSTEQDLLNTLRMAR
jgi:hypothetical protein